MIDVFNWQVRSKCITLLTQITMSSQTWTFYNTHLQPQRFVQTEHSILQVHIFDPLCKLNVTLLERLCAHVALSPILLSAVPCRVSFGLYGID